MAIYSAGRRRTMIILLLTSILLITLDLRGSVIFDALRSGFGYAQEPFDIAGEVVTRPVSRLWDGIARVDDLERENEELRAELDSQRAAVIAGLAAIQENRELREAINLESLANLRTRACSVIGLKPSNFDQRVEIDCGSSDGLKVGMAVVNEAGLVGKVHRVTLESSIVMLVTDPEFAVPVKVIAEVDPTPTTTTPPTVPSGLGVDQVTVPATPEASTSEATGETTGDAATESSSEATADSTPVTTPVTAPPTGPPTTTTTLPPIKVTRETGVLNGVGGDRLPKVIFIADSPLFGLPLVGDAVLTAGGSDSNAPPDIPIGNVANVIADGGVEGLRLEVETSADLDRLNIVRVVLYLSQREAPGLEE